MFSGQGTNFVDAEREMREMVQKLNNDYNLKENLQQKGLEWAFNPPFAPHMGSALESMVKLPKRAITATANGAQLTDEELITVAAKCEAMLNNRPLTYVGSESDDLEPLTPVRFQTTRQMTPLQPSK